MQPPRPEAELPETVVFRMIKLPPPAVAPAVPIPAPPFATDVPVIVLLRTIAELNCTCIPAPLSQVWLPVITLPSKSVRSY